MSTDVEARNPGTAVSEPSPHQAERYIWKLRVICAVLVLWALLCTTILWMLVRSDIMIADTQPWAVMVVLASVGGMVGGLARSLYFFSFDSYAFNHRLRTGKSSKWALSVCPDLDDEFDPVWVWYLWCLKPLVGAAVGLVFALAVGIGLVSLSTLPNPTADVSLRLLVLGGFGGFFSEGVFERMLRVVQPRGANPGRAAQPGALFFYFLTSS